MREKRQSRLSALILKRIHILRGRFAYLAISNILALAKYIFFFAATSLKKARQCAYIDRLNFT